MIKYFLICLFALQAFSQPMIIDHRYSDITTLPEDAILTANATLCIAYGHTSHGSQITTGMEGLVAFANNGGKGLTLQQDIFAQIDLRDGILAGDVGYYPAWVNNTISYLDGHPEINVVMWSWCGQVEDKYTDGVLYSEYLDPMTQLEIDYPDVNFVYMTGHLDYWHYSSLTPGNKVIKDYCIENNKILYDFADIESWNPDGEYFPYATDGCDYYSSLGGSYVGNWAIEWQNSHTEGVDWYDCSSAHSEPLNANQKAYAAWWMFAKIAGYEDISLSIELISFELILQNNCITAKWTVGSETNNLGFNIYRSIDGVNFIKLNDELIKGRGNSSISADYEYRDYKYKDFNVTNNMYWYKLEDIDYNGTVTTHQIKQIEFSNEIKYNLLQNYPNPFNSKTKIDFVLSTPSKCSLIIYDVSGKIVNTLLDNVWVIDNYTTHWNGISNTGKHVASGIYIYLLKTSDYEINKKMIYIK